MSSDETSDSSCDFNELQDSFSLSVEESSSVSDSDSDSDPVSYSTDSKNESFNSFESDDESEISSDDIEI